MWQILHTSFWKFSKLSNSGISLNWSIIDEVTTHNTTTYFLAHSVVQFQVAADPRTKPTELFCEYIC